MKKNKEKINTYPHTREVNSFKAGYTLNDASDTYIDSKNQSLYEKPDRTVF